MYARPIIPLASAALLLSGCSANYSSIYRSEHLDREDHLITQDAKSKAILRQVRAADGKLTTCIEPSPDALSVFAASASGNLTTPEQISAAFGGTRSESGANIGLRTQTITILRDQGYRICEAYANSGITDVDYTQLVRRNQVMTTAVLAIEQLTGAVVGPSAAIGASASLEVDQAAVTAAADKVASQEKVVAAQQGSVTEKAGLEAKAKSAFEDAAGKTKAKKAELDGMKDDDPKKPAVKQDYETLAANELKLKGEYDTAQKATLAEKDKLAGEQRALNVLKQNLKDVQSPDLKSRTASTLNGAYVVSKDIPGVAYAVQSIVDLAFSKSYLMDLCQMYWTGGVKNASAQLGTICSQTMDMFFYTSKVQADVWAEVVKKSAGAASVYSPGANPTITSGIPVHSPNTPFSASIDLFGKFR